MHVRQGNALGLGHAIRCAHPVIGDEPFAVVLPDVLIDNVLCNFTTDNLAYMMAEYEKTGISQIMVEGVPYEEVNKYGIVDLDKADLSTGQSVKVHGVIEKPEVNKAPSNLAIVGRYIFSPKLWQCLKRTPLGVGGEIQLTDAIDLTLITGKSHDCGSKLGYLQTNFLYTLRRKDIVGDKGKKALL